MRKYGSTGRGVAKASAFNIFCATMFSASAYFGELAAVASAISYSIGVMFYRVASLRFGALPLIIFNNAVAVCLLFLFVLLGGISIVPSLSAGAWARVILSGILGLVFGDFLFLLALRQLGAGLQAIVGCLYAPFVMLAAFFLFQESLPPLGLFGAALVVLAVPLAATESVQVEASKGRKLIGVVLGALSVFFSGFAVLIIRDIYRAELLLPVVAFRFLAGFIVLASVGMLCGQRADVVKLFSRGSHLKIILPGAFFGQFLAVLLWFVGFKYTLAGKAATLNELSALFIFLLAVVFLKEPLTRRRLVALILGFLGAVIVGLS